MFSLFSSVTSSTDSFVRSWYPVTHPRFYHAITSAFDLLSLAMVFLVSLPISVDVPPFLPFLCCSQLYHCFRLYCPSICSLVTPFRISSVSFALNSPLLFVHMLCYFPHRSSSSLHWVPHSVLSNIPYSPMRWKKKPLYEIDTEISTQPSKWNIVSEPACICVINNWRYSCILLGPHPPYHESSHPCWPTISPNCWRRDRAGFLFLQDWETRWVNFQFLTHTLGWQTYW